MKTGFKNINMRQRVPALRAGLPAFRARAGGGKPPVPPPAIPVKKGGK